MFHDDNTGYVVRCNECEKIQIGFSNLMMTFSLDDFAGFRKWLQKLLSEQDLSEKQTIRNIVIPTPCEGMKILLSIRELRDFNKMLDTADTELQSLEMIRLFDEQ